MKKIEKSSILYLKINLHTNALTTKESHINTRKKHLCTKHHQTLTPKNTTANHIILSMEQTLVDVTSGITTKLTTIANKTYPIQKHKK